MKVGAAALSARIETRGQGSCRALLWGPAGGAGGPGAPLQEPPQGRGVRLPSVLVWSPGAGAPPGPSFWLFLPPRWVGPVTLPAPPPAAPLPPLELLPLPPLVV